MLVMIWFINTYMYWFERPKNVFFISTHQIFRTGIAKVVGSGGGAVGGGLTLVGGLLTIMSAGAALPVLLVGTGIGLASGVTGGAAAIAEKIIKASTLFTDMRESWIPLAAHGGGISRNLVSAYSCISESYNLYY